MLCACGRGLAIFSMTKKQIIRNSVPCQVNCVYKMSLIFIVCLCFAVLDFENVVETGSETEDDDRLLVSEEDGLLNGAGSPISLINHESLAPPSPNLDHTLLRKTVDEEDDMKDSGIENVWHENDLLSTSVDGTGKFHSFLLLRHAPFS